MSYRLWIDRCLYDASPDEGQMRSLAQAAINQKQWVRLEAHSGAGEFEVIMSS